MPYTVLNCPLCRQPQTSGNGGRPGSEQISTFDVVKHHIEPPGSTNEAQLPNSAGVDKRYSFQGEPIAYRLCMYCGLVYQSPCMSDEELDSFYEQEYRQLYQGSQGPNPKDLAVQRGRAQSLLDFTQRSLSTVHRHLDIGCSAGLLLESFQAAYHCEPVGVEPGTAYRTFAQAHGLKVYPTLPDLKTQPEARFDLITLAHVLEHIPNPVEYVAALRQEWLTTDGSLLVEIPNLYGHDCFEIAHLVSYSPHTLEQTLQQAGFRMESMSAHGRPRSEVIPLYITALARPDEGKTMSNQDGRLRVTPENGVRRKRKMAMFRRKVVTRLFPHKAWLPVPGPESA
jgi:hypothetical protein